MSPETDILGYDMAEDEETDRYVMAGEDDGDDGSSSVRSDSYMTGEGGTTSDFPSTAALAHGRRRRRLRGGLNGRL